MVKLKSEKWRAATVYALEPLPIVQFQDNNSKRFIGAGDVFIMRDSLDAGFVEEDSE
jgi:hypothetical protein